MLVTFGLLFCCEITVTFLFEYTFSNYYSVSRHFSLLLLSSSGPFLPVLNHKIRLFVLEDSSLTILPAAVYTIIWTKLLMALQVLDDPWIFSFLYDILILIDQ